MVPLGTETSKIVSEVREFSLVLVEEGWGVRVYDPFLVSGYTNVLQG